MAVIQNERFLPLHETWRLKFGDPVQTFLVHLDGEAAGQQRRRFFQFGRVALIEHAHGGQKALQPRAVERCLIQVLRGSHECPRPPSHGADQGPQISAGMRREKHQHLLRALGNVDGQALRCRICRSMSYKRKTISPAAGWSIRSKKPPP